MRGKAGNGSASSSPTIGARRLNFRWRYSTVDYMGSGASLDKILLEEAPHSRHKHSVINTTSWEAGDVNYNKAVTSAMLNLLNDGEEAMTITGVSFRSSNFSTSLHKDLVLDSRESVDFNITFAAGTTSAWSKTR